MAVVPSAELVAAISATLTTPLASHTEATPGYDLYEAFLFAMCIAAAESTGLTTTFEHTDGTAATGLILRTAPSTINSQAQMFTHAVLSDQVDARYEVHLGIYVRGSSGVRHEGDVVILTVDEAARARALGTDPRISKAVAVIEAKFHAADLGLRYGREFVGLDSDLSKGRAILATSSDGPSAYRLLSHRDRKVHFELVPGSAQEEELRRRVAGMLRDFKARQRRVS